MRALIFVVFSIFMFSLVFSFEVSESFEDNQELRDRELLREPYLGTPGLGKERCEGRSSLQQGVECRLQLKIKNEDYPEVCEGLTQSSSCLDLFTFSEVCFSEFAGSDIYYCLEDIALDQREFMVLLLYSLDKQVSTAYYGGEVSLHQASKVKTLILQTQRELLLGYSKYELQDNVDMLETLWREYMK